MGKKAKKGFTLVEVVIAVAVTAILLAAVLSFAGSALTMSSRMHANATVEEVHNVFQNVLSGELQNASNIEIYKNQTNEQLFTALKAAKALDTKGRRALIFVYQEPNTFSNGVKVMYRPGVYVYSAEIDKVVGTSDSGAANIITKLAALSEIKDIAPVISSPAPPGVPETQNGGARLLFTPDFYAMQGWHFNFTPYKFHNDVGKEVYFIASHIASYDTAKSTGSLFSRIGHFALDGSDSVTGTLLSTDETSVVFECYNVVAAKQGDTAPAKNPPRVVGRFGYKYIDTWYTTDEDSVTYNKPATWSGKLSGVLPGGTLIKDTHNIPNYRASGTGAGYVLAQISANSAGYSPVWGLGDKASASRQGFNVMRALPLPDGTADKNVPLMVIYDPAFS